MTDTAKGATFPRLLLQHAQRRPRPPAYREKDLGIWQTATWAQAASEVRSLASGLAAMGFKRGMNLAVVGDSRPRLYWAMVAAQCLGEVKLVARGSLPDDGKVIEDARQYR